MTGAGADTRGEREADATQRLRLAQLWLFVLLLFAGLLSATVGAIGKSNTVYWGVVALTGLLAGGVFVASGLPARAYGLTLENAPASLRGALFSSAILTALGIIAVLGGRAAGWIDASLPVAELRLDAQTVAYVLLATPLQEIVFRGLFQTGARVIFGGRRQRVAVAAVTFSTLAFALSHLPWGLVTVLVMIVPGVVWGIQAERERSLVGVTLSHAAVGYLLVGVSPLWSALRGLS